MDRLPIEILSNILRMTIADDQDIACQLSLVNKATQQLVSPLLYKHVCLSGTAQIRRFNTSFKVFSQVKCDLIKGVTLLDKEFSLAAQDKVHEKLEQEVRAKGGWIKQWKEIIQIVGNLSRKHHLTTLVVFSEVEKRFQYTNVKCNEPLASQLKFSNIKVDHLVLFHCDLDFFLERIQATKVTWYGCEVNTINYDSMSFDYRPRLRSKQIQEIQLFFGENPEPWDASKVVENTSDKRSWTAQFAQDISCFCQTQTKPPKISVAIHRRSQDAKERLEKEFNSTLKQEIKVDLWGRMSDSNQRVAELMDCASKGWIQQKNPIVEIVTKSGFKVQDVKSRIGKWTVMTPPGKQWCGCSDIEKTRRIIRAAMERMQNHDSDDEDDYGINYSFEDGWSDNSDNWDPMQRLAFMSGESYHYSQAYLDQYAL